MVFSLFWRFCLLAGLTVFALGVAAVEFTDLENTLRKHPSLQQLDFEATAHREHAVAATALPDPELSLNFNNVPLSDPSFDRFLPSNKAVGVLQMFPNRSGRAARSARMHTNAEQLEALRAARFSELRGHMIVELVGLQRIAGQRELARAQSIKFDELVEVVEAEINAGRPALFRLAEIERVRAEVARKLVVLDAQETRIHLALAEKVGVMDYPGAPPISIVTWNNDPLMFHAVRVAEFEKLIADEGINEALAQWKTNWGVHFTYQQRSSGRGEPLSEFDGDDWFSAGIKFTVPVWGKHKQAPNVRAARAQRSSAHAKVSSVVRHSVARYKSLLADRNEATATRLVLLEKIEAIQAEISAQQSNYESGAGDYAPVIDAELALLSLQEQIVVLQANIESSIALSNSLLVTP